MGCESEENGDADPMGAQIQKRTTSHSASDRTKCFPVFWDVYSNSATPFTQKPKGIENDTIDCRRNSGFTEGRYHRHRRTGKKHPSMLQGDEHPPSSYQRQGSMHDSCLLSPDAQIFGEAGAFAADKLLFQKSAIRF